MYMYHCRITWQNGLKSGSEIELRVWHETGLTEYRFNWFTLDWIAGWQHDNKMIKLLTTNSLHRKFFILKALNDRINKFSTCCCSSTSLITVRFWRKQEGNVFSHNWHSGHKGRGGGVLGHHPGQDRPHCIGPAPVQAPPPVDMADLTVQPPPPQIWPPGQYWPHT